jgi:hypothetical protein
MHASDAMGCSGKSTLAKKIYHFSNSLGKLVFGCAATGLATQVYEDFEFETKHLAFGVPFYDEDETEENFDNINRVRCNITEERKEYITAVEVIIIDEAFSNHKYFTQSILNTFNQLRGKVVIFLTDRGQTAPVIKFGTRRQIVNASIINSGFWDQVIVYTLTKNLRLLALRDASNSADYDQQKKYADALVEIRSNGPFSSTSPVSIIYENPDDGFGEKVLIYDTLH